MDFTQYGNIGWLILRVAIAVIFIYHAIPKLKNPEAMAGGIGFPAWGVRLLGIVELFSGLAIGLDIFTGLVSLLLAVVMIGAIYYKISKWKLPFWSQTNTGWEFDFVLLAVLLFLLTNSY
jgi:putative oxidoreductase